jgi:hypothetical protein
MADPEAKKRNTAQALVRRAESLLPAVVLATRAKTAGSPTRPSARAAV